jgi:sulfur-carrier protein adenylyltransferase/sulfurtransferase
VEDRVRLIEDARRNVAEVAPADAKAEIDSGSVGLILDVREAHEWRKVHIPGAIRIPLDEVAEKADPSLSTAESALTAHAQDRIIVYCATGIRSLLGGHALVKLGYADVASLAGGVTQWQKDGFPTER